MKDKTVVFTKHIHSTFSSFSSNDVFLKIVAKMSELDFTPNLNTTIQSKKFPALNGETIEEITGDSKFAGVYVSDEKTFYNKALHERNHFGNFHKTPEFNALVQKYKDKGFAKIDYIEEQEKYRERERQKQSNLLKKCGVVLYMDYEEYSKNPPLYQGGFSDAVFRSPKLYQYVSKGGVYGWIGNSSVRTSEHDIQIETGLRKRGISSSEMYNWISSSNGRHFAESLDGYTKKEQKAKINASLNNMYNCCIIYGCPSHEGLFKDTVDIEEKLKKINLLLPANETFYKEVHTINIIASKKMLEKSEDFTPEEKIYLDTLINEIFANIA